MNGPEVDPDALFHLSQTILDQVNCSILVALANGATTANEIVRYLRLPMTTCYRRLNWLAKQGLVRETLKRCEGRGGPYRIYTSKVESFTLRYEGSQISLDLSLSDRPDQVLSYQQRFAVSDLPGRNRRIVGSFPTNGTGG